MMMDGLKVLNFKAMTNYIDKEVIFGGPTDFKGTF